jgi:hypothetical protein
MNSQPARYDVTLLRNFPFSDSFDLFTKSSLDSNAQSPLELAGATFVARAVLGDERCLPDPQQGLCDFTVLVSEEVPNRIFIELNKDTVNSVAHVLGENGRGIFQLGMIRDGNLTILLSGFLLVGNSVFLGENS